MKLRIALAALGMLACNASGQQHSVPDLKAADAAAPVPRAQYRSAFDDYVPYREQPAAAWRESNDEVGRAGGHIGIFRGAGHGRHGHSTSAQPPAGERGARPANEPAGQPTVRSAPQAAPSGGHQGH